MIEKKKPSRYVLDYTKFAETPAYELAVVVHRETEAQRATEARAFKAQHGDIPPPTNALLMGLLGPYNSSAPTPWSEYTKSFDVLERCRAELGVPLGDVAKRIALELRPENWEVIFWMGTWLQALDQKSNIEFQFQEHKNEIERAKRERSESAVNAAHASHAKDAEAKAYVLQEWALHKQRFKGNRTSFAKTYVEVILSKFNHEVAMKTIHAIWLKGR
jgi:hypothetical protein